MPGSKQHVPLDRRSVLDGCGLKVQRSGSERLTPKRSKKRHYQKLTDARNYIPCRSDNSCAGPNVWSSMGTGNISLYMNELKETTPLPIIKRHSSVIICPVCAVVSVTLAPSIRPKRKTSHGSVPALRPYIP